jgi:hypothetical protein
MRSGKGYLVTTKTGKLGRTYHSDGLINGKKPVYIEGEEKPILCYSGSLNLKGFID